MLQNERFEQDWGFYYKDNQVFAEKDFIPLAAALQEKQQGGGGIVVTTELTTVENARWGVPAGFVANVTWACLFCA